MRFAKLPFISPIARAFQKPQDRVDTEVAESAPNDPGPSPEAVPEDELETESLEDIFGNSELSKSKDQEEGALPQAPSDEQEPANPFKKASAGGEGGHVPPYIFIGPGGPGVPGAAIEPGAPGTAAPEGMQLSQAHIDYHTKAWDPSTPETSGRPGEKDGGQPGESSGSVNVQDRLSATLEDIFHKKVVTDPLLKALLEKHGDVDIKQLASELDEFSTGLGANQQHK